MEGRRAQIRMSSRQVAKNISYTGFFLGVLASLAARAIPLAARALLIILPGLTTGLRSGGINRWGKLNHFFSGNVLAPC